MYSVLRVLILVALQLTVIQAAWAQMSCADFSRATSKGTGGEKLRKFLALHWKYTMLTRPEWATQIGYPGLNDRWRDWSLEAISSEKKITNCQFKALERIPRGDLNRQESLNFDLLHRDLALAIAGHKYPSEFLVLDQLSGLQIDLPDLIAAMPTANLRDYENILARLEKVPSLVEQVKILLRTGAKAGITPVRVFLQKVPAQFDSLLTAKIEESPLFSPFKNFDTALSESERAALVAKARKVIGETVYPALKSLREYVVNAYIPQSREFIAFSQMPNGRKWYEYNVRMHTTTDLTPEQLHALGLQEVDRIRIEMEKVKAQTGFKGDVAAFHRFLLQDPQFYFDAPSNLLAGYRDIAKRVDAQLPRLFRNLPRLPYGVREMPAYKAASAPTAYYMGGSLEAGRAGMFEANTHDLKARPKWGMEALTLHEAVPGHHLQIALGQELEDLPEFRRHASHTAFVEGWALYAESLGEALGLYTDPYAKYGGLVYEMWRAVRLVVDTGVHMNGWSRERAIEYFMNHLPKSRMESEVEVDRYVTWPGQALAYKVGQLKIRELRELASKELGVSFDVRDFHDLVLRNGALPLAVLEKQVAQWLATKRRLRNQSV